MAGHAAHHPNTLSESGWQRDYDQADAVLSCRLSNAEFIRQQQADIDTRRAHAERLAREGHGAAVHWAQLVARQQEELDAYARSVVVALEQAA